MPVLFQVAFLASFAWAALGIFHVFCLIPGNNTVLYDEMNFDLIETNNQLISMDIVSSSRSLRRLKAVEPHQPQLTITYTEETKSLRGSNERDSLAIIITENGKENSSLSKNSALNVSVGSTKEDRPVKVFVIMGQPDKIQVNFNSKMGRVLLPTNLFIVLSQIMFTVKTYLAGS
jgi:hypothetical protein